MFGGKFCWAAGGISRAGCSEVDSSLRHRVIPWRRSPLTTAVSLGCAEPFLVVEDLGGDGFFVVEVRLFKSHGGDVHQGATIAPPGGGRQ